MSDLPYHSEQLEFMQALAQHRLEWLDPFFRFLNYFDTLYFFFALVPFVWLGFSYRWGLRLFYWLIFNNLINGAAKTLIGWPRPSTLIPAIGLFHPTSNGFPSGGAQTCMFLGALLIYHWKHKAAWLVGLCYIALISFSRLYLGVHYPLDVIGGWVLGLSLAILFIHTKTPLEAWLTRQGPQFCLFLTLLIPSLILYFFPHPGHARMMGAVMGVGIGSYFSLTRHLFLSAPRDLNEGVGRAFIGLSFLFLLLFLLPNPKSFPTGCLTGLFMSLGASPLCRWFLQKKL